MWQARATQHQVSRLEISDPIADKCLARCRGDEVQFAFVVEMPARQGCRKPMGQTAHHAGFLRRFVSQRRQARVIMLEFRLALAWDVALASRGHNRKLIHHTAAIDIERLSGNVRSFVAGEEHRGTGNIFRRAHITQRHGFADGDFLFTRF